MNVRFYLMDGGRCDAVRWQTEARPWTVYQTAKDANRNTHGTRIPARPTLAQAPCLHERQNMKFQLVGLWVAVGFLTTLFLGFVFDVYRQTSPDALSRITMHTDLENLEARIQALEAATGATR